MMRWFREVLHIPDQHFSLGLYIYPDTSERSVKRYWSKITRLPLDQFEKVQIDRRKNKSTKKRNTLPYGTLRITIRSRGNSSFGVTLHRRIMGYIEAVYKTNAGIV